MHHPSLRVPRRSALLSALAGAAVIAAGAAPAEAAHHHRHHHRHAHRHAHAAFRGHVVRARIVRLLAVGSPRRDALAARHRSAPVPTAPVRTAKPKPKPTPVPKPAPTPSPTPSPTPGGGGAPITAWRPPGSRPLSDAAAAALVRPARETRPDNAAAISYRPTAAELDAFRNGERDKYGRTAVQYNPLAAYVTGGFTGTTDEILQWAAFKWGIPEDVVRAVAANESNWHMSQLGDRGAVPDTSVYPAYSRVSGTSDVFLSLGISQIKWRPGALHVGTDPLRWKSTAFSIDYWAANVRYYYDGLCDWCGSGYSAGQAWASVGAWYNPSPWGSSTDYVDHVKAKVAARPWAQPGF